MIEPEQPELIEEIIRMFTSILIHPGLSQCRVLVMCDAGEVELDLALGRVAHL